MDLGFLSIAKLYVLSSLETTADTAVCRAAEFQSSKQPACRKVIGD
jgi:hypothetical protein